MADSYTRVLAEEWPINQKLSRFSGSRVMDWITDLDFWGHKIFEKNQFEAIGRAYALKKVYSFYYSEYCYEVYGKDGITIADAVKLLTGLFATEFTGDQHIMGKCFDIKLYKTCVN